MFALLIAAQAATPPPASAAPPPVSASSAPPAPAWSILQPVGTEPCIRNGKTMPDDIVVCGRPLPSQKLPYPDEVAGPPHGVNPRMDGRGALAAEATPCAARSGGCQTGVDIFGAGTALVRLVQKVVAPSSCCETPGEGTSVVALGEDVVHGVKGAFRKQPDRGNRVAIPLDDAPPKSVILP